MEILEKNFVQDRLSEIAAFKKLNMKELAAEVGVPYTTFHHYASGRSAPKLDFVVALHTYGINLDWFVSGEGEMYRVNRNSYRQDVVNHGNGANVVTTGVNNGNIVTEGSDTGDRVGHLCGFVAWFMQTQPEAARVYLEEHLRRTVPEFAQWKKGHGSDAAN